MAHHYLIYTTILLKGASVFCWVLVFGIFLPSFETRICDLWCWLCGVCFCWFRCDCWKLKVSQFQAFVQLQMWPNRSWSPSWVRWGAVLRLPVGGGCCCGCCVSTQAILAGETPTWETWDSHTFRRPAHGRTISDEMTCLELNCDEIYEKDWHECWL